MGQHDFWAQYFVQEFWPIEKDKNKLNKLWIMYEFKRNKKNSFEQKLAHFKSFWAHKLT